MPLSKARATFVTFMVCQRTLHLSHCALTFTLTENTLSCIASLFLNLDAGVQRNRLMNKFDENDNEKITRVVELFNLFATRYAAAQTQFDLLPLTDPAQRLAQEIEGGLGAVQTAALVIAHICASSDEHRRRAFVELAARQVDPRTVEEHCRNGIEQTHTSADPQYTALLAVVEHARLSEPV